MRRFPLALCFVPLLLAYVLPAQAVVNTYQTLIIEPGETFGVSGTIYKSVSIHVQAGGVLVLPKGSYGSPETWRLQLIAPWVRIDGRVLADGASLNIEGRGAPGGNFTGPGGSGYGGRGGDVENAPGSGGPSYDSPNRLLESPGSQGVDNDHGGGGSLRVDAWVLTVTSNAVLSANAYPSAATGGGGSGGSILLNGVHTFLNAYTLRANGGKGQTSTLLTPTLTPVPGGGGGAGGRLRIFLYPDFQDGGGMLEVHGGQGGGGAALNGDPGTIEHLPALMPLVPQLMQPNDGQEVGLAPTFTFKAEDPMLSQFLIFHIQIATDVGFAPADIVHESFQGDLGEGWAGTRYYASNATASYYLPILLSTNTTYYWRVMATNGGGFSPFSSPRQFRTIGFLNHPPLQPLLQGPADEQVFVSKLPVFCSVGADPDGNTLTFGIILSQDPELSNPKLFQSTYPGWDADEYPPSGAYAGVTAYCQVLNTTSYPDALQPGATYYWQTVAYDSYQQTSRSARNRFTVLPLPSTPGLLGPADQAVVTTRAPTLTLSATSPTGASLRYRLELSSDEFRTVITFLSESSPGWDQTSYASGATASLRIPEAYSLVPGKTYSWRAASYDPTDDNWSETSAAQTFQVVTPPLLPVLISPADGYAAPDPGLTFTFYATSESGNTLTYHCELSADGFRTVLQAFDQRTSASGWDASAYASGSAANFTLPASASLERGRTYAWRVQAWDGVSWGEVSGSRTFTVANALEVRRARLYPNPAVSTATLHLDLELSVDADVTLRICNGVGRVVAEHTFAARGGGGGDPYSLDIGSLASGVYFCIIETRSLYGTRRTTRRFAVVN